MNRRNIICWLFAMMCMCASAQIISDKDPSEISVFLGGGLASIHYQDAPRAGLFNGFALEFGIAYTYYFHRNWGVYFGAGPGIYKTDKHFSFDVFNPDLTDQNGYQFDLYTQPKYNEIFQTMFINIPIMLQYQTKQKNQRVWQSQQRYKGFYIMGGVKVGVPLNDAYESKITSITNAAYYPQFDNWAATQLFAGLGAFADVSSSTGNLGLNIPCLKLAFEAGFKWRVGSNFLLYTGAFCDYGLNNTVSSRPPIRNNIAVDHITDFALLSFSENLNMMTAGIILRLSFFQTPRSECAFNPYGNIRNTKKY